MRHAKKGVCGRFKKFKSELNQNVALYQLRSSSGQLCRVKPREEAEVVGMVGFNIVKHQNIFTHVHTHRDRCCGHTKQEGEGGMEDQIEGYENETQMCLRVFLIDHIITALQP